MPILFDNCRTRFKYVFITGFFCLFHVALRAQSGALQTQLLQYTNGADSLVNSYSPEKVYLQFDKPYYAIKDTMWMKAYLLNASSLLPSGRSGLLHIDISNDSGKLVKQYLLSLSRGTGAGEINLDEGDFKTGTYTLCAYTNWMRNFGTETFFYKSFYITNANEHNWLINAKTTTRSPGDKNLVDLGLQFNNPDKTPYENKPLQLQVMVGSHNLYAQKVQTGANGQIDVNFALPGKTVAPVIVAENENKDRKATIPINAGRPEDTDLQFLPEGGNLVAGLPSRIGFKAIGADGKGINVSGVVTGNDHQQLATFQSLHNGMGSFYLDIKPGENYIAKMNLPGGATKEYPLPAVKNSGTVLQVKNALESDSVALTVAATEDIVQANSSYFLIGKARGIVCYAAIIRFNKVNFVRKNISKQLFPPGITHFILMTTDRQPLNERLVYIDHHDDELNIKLSTDLTDYNPRDSIALHIQAADNAGRPVRGNFSLAVTDDDQVKTDSVNGDNMLTQMFLTADLKGYVEAPGYYLEHDSSNWQALDNLLLTQGWIGYELQSPGMPFKPEHEFEVRGNVLNIFNKPVKHSNVLLFSKSPPMLMDTVTNNDGQFVFNHFPKVDTAVFVLKAVNKNGKSFNVRINIDQATPPVLDRSKIPATIPWYVNTDTTLLNYMRKNAQSQLNAFSPTGKNVLKEVKIYGKKLVKDSQNLNGPGNADVVLDEKDMEKAGKKNFLELIEENVPGFHEGFFLLTGPSMKAQKDRELAAFIADSGSSTVEKIAGRDQFWYFINNKPVKFIIDGISLYQIMPITSPAITGINDYLRSHSAEDIKGIEVMYSTKYANRYVPIEFGMSIGPSEVAFVEITTRSGHGPAINSTPGMYLYKPLTPMWARQFYKPKYAANDTTRHLPDLRSTITWEPNILTGADGKATIYFFAAEKPTTYTVITEGTDRNGNIGYKRRKIVIGKKGVVAGSK